MVTSTTIANENGVNVDEYGRVEATMAAPVCYHRSHSEDLRLEAFHWDVSVNDCLAQASSSSQFQTQHASLT